MAGTGDGGRAAAATNVKKYGPDFYARIGAMGGKKGRTGGFASDLVGTDGLTGRERARIQGALGGRISRRTKKDPVVVALESKSQKPASKRKRSDVELAA